MTTTTEDATKPAAVERNTQLEGKWGKKVIEAGYTSVPDVLIRYQQRLKLKPLDVNVLLHLLSYWWKAPGLPRRGQDRGLGPARVHSANVERTRAGQQDLFAARAGEPAPKAPLPRARAKQRRGRGSRAKR